MKKITLILVSILAWASCRNTSDDTMRVACNLPMTGDFSLYGESVRKGIVMAHEDLAAQYTADGISISYDFQDNAGDSKNSVTVFKRQEMQGYDIYMSGITQQTAAILPLQKASGKPHFIWSFVPLVLTADNNIFRTWVDYPQEATCFVAYLEKHPEFKKVACVYPNAQSAQSLFNDLFIPILPENTSLVYNEAFDVSTSSFKDIVLKIKSTNPDIIFVNGWDNHLPNLIKELVANGLKKEGNLVFTFDLMDAVPKISADLLDGLIANIPGSEVTPSEAMVEWKKRFKEKYGTEANYTNAYAYDLGLILFDLAKRAKVGDDADLSQLLLETNIDGITGKLTFSPEGMLFGEYVTTIYNENGFTPLN